jgi:hypothetical protein
MFLFGVVVWLIVHVLFHFGLSLHIFQHTLIATNTLIATIECKTIVPIFSFGIKLEIFPFAIYVCDIYSTEAPVAP